MASDGPTPPLRRRRRRATAGQRPPKPPAQVEAPMLITPAQAESAAHARPEAVHLKAVQPEAMQPQPQQAPPHKQRSQRPSRNSQGRDAGDRGLRDLVGSGSSQLGLSGALRARDVNRPSEEDLAAAERSIVLVRRNWKPPAEA
jgi:hypothetical protein